MYGHVITVSKFLLSVSAEYQILCGNQAPGFIIDIHTGKPIGKDENWCGTVENWHWYKAQFTL